MSITMSPSAFYDMTGLEQIAVNLFYGWGYNFYRLENQLRADDLLLRAKVSWLLGISRGVLETAQSEYRRTFRPTRAKPFPDDAAIEAASTLESLCGLVGQLEGRIRALPAPENDRMTQRYRQEAETLIRLGQYDMQLAARADILRNLLDGKDATWVLENVLSLKEGIAAMTRNVQDRQELLQS